MITHTCYDLRRRRRRFDGNPHPARNESAGCNISSEGGSTPRNRSRRSTDFAAATLPGGLSPWMQQNKQQLWSKAYGYL